MTTTEFRAWDKENKEWVMTRSGGQSLNYKTRKLEYTYSDTFDLQDWETLRKIGAFPGNYEIVQFTGLKDKNGREAYTECVVKYIDDSGTPQVGIIVDLGWKFYIEAFGGDNEGNQDLEIHPDNEFEIIGNKFENPELLKTGT